MKKRKILGAAALLVAALIAADLIISKYCLYTRRFDVPCSRLPDEFDGFRIVQISDLHNAEFGKDNSKLIEAVKRESPDIIALTGDIVDLNTRDFGKAADLLAKLSAVAPCFYVTGNHEIRIYNDFRQFEKNISDYVTVLRSQAEEIVRNGAKIYICGIDDPNYSSAFGENLKKLAAPDGFKVLLAHRPERFRMYAANGFDLILSGHTHGGQIRLPFIGAVIAPSQGLLPEYDSGLYTLKNSVMIISRGMGASDLPVRFCNRPEIVVIDLKSADTQ